MTGVFNTLGEAMFAAGAVGAGVTATVPRNDGGKYMAGSMEIVARAVGVTKHGIPKLYS